MSDSRAELISVSRPKQARSEQTMERILDAAEALLTEKGVVSAVSIAEIVHRAKSSTGSFYARFKDKNQLLQALEERFFNELARLLEELSENQDVAGMPTPLMVKNFNGEMIKLVSTRQHLIRAFIYRATQGETLGRKETKRFQDVTARFIEIVLARREEISHPSPELAVPIAAETVNTVMQRWVLSGNGTLGGRKVSGRALRDELTRIYLDYLGIPWDEKLFREPSRKPPASAKKRSRKRSARRK